MSDSADGTHLERLREELAQKTEEVRILREVSSRINTTLVPAEIYEIVLHTMRDLFGFSHALILLLDESAGTLSVAACGGYSEPCVGARVEVGVGVIGTVAKRKKMMRVGNLGQQRTYVEAIRREMEEAGRPPRVEALPTLPGLTNAESQLAIPLLVGERLVGVFFVESAERRVFSERDETLVTIVANLCASAIHNALLYRRTKDELGVVKELRAKEAGHYDLSDIAGGSPAIVRVRDLLAKVARSPASTILITGENGTGKDLAAKVIHHLSARAQAPFMNITCSALAEALLESELFGHQKGAFTDAHRDKKGLLELADGGSVFLDEIGEMSVGLQAKLLRFLEEKTFKRVGGSQDVRVDVRIIAATNRDLARMVRDGGFREDLYYRLRVLPVELPPLRERPGDVKDLARGFLRQFCAEFNKDLAELPADVLAELTAYPWPGNVRELRNAIERAVLLSDGPRLKPEDFRVSPPASSAPGALRLPAEGLRFEELERDLVIQALERAGWNRARAAKLLGMPRDWLRYRMEKLDLRPPGE